MDTPSATLTGFSFWKIHHQPSSGVFPMTSGQLTYTLPDAARRLGVSVGTVYNLLKDGKLDGVALGKRRLVTERSMRRLIDESGGMDADCRRNSSLGKAQ